MKDHPGAVEAHSRSLEIGPGAVESHTHTGSLNDHPPAAMMAHPGAMEAHPGALEAHPGALEAHSKAVEAHPGIMVNKRVHAEIRKNKKVGDFEIMFSAVAELMTDNNSQIYLDGKYISLK